MKNRLSKYKVTRAWLIPIGAGLLTMIMACYIAWFTLQYEIELKKRVAQNELSVIINQMENLTNRQIDMAKGLAAFQQERPDASFEELTHFSEKLLADQTEILKTVVLTKDTTVTFIYPLEGNESVLGVDLTTVSNQKQAVIQAKQTMRPVMTQPIRLIQGGMGIIFRIPQMAYKEGISEDFIGLMNVVINYDRLLGSAGVLKATQQYDLRILQQNNLTKEQTEIFYTTDKLLNDPIEMMANLKENYWYLEMAPINGWSEEAYLYYLVLGAGSFLALIICFYLRSLIRTKEELNSIVLERTQALSQSNETLQESLLNLKKAQDQLIQAEKLAGLGELVAGVAHEINTPLGVGITLTSFINEKHSTLSQNFSTNTITKRELSDYFRETSEALCVLDSSLNKAAEIVRSFKNVAVEQSTLERRTFKLKQYVNDLLLSLSPKWKHTNYKINLSCPDSLEIVSYPGAISQILTQLINNSLSHGFKDRDEGVIHIEFQLVGSSIRLVYSDDGQGIPQDAQSKVFNPFYTINRQLGSAGLGLHIVHNLTTQILKGDIQLISIRNNGTQFIITFPIKID